MINKPMLILNRFSSGFSIGNKGKKEGSQVTDISGTLGTRFFQEKSYLLAGGNE